MGDIIHLLPDNIANQIAAGEVIQRPASVVKELIENSLDAGSTEIKLIIKDAGKTLIQVVDNGKGMSQTDARMCFERHATSKISEANDLFSIKTMGFRGEALASIAAIARIELITKQSNDEVGTSIIIEGSNLVKQEGTTTVNGTNISVKNLFFNVPARRKFLKTDAVELKYISQEFLRTALANSEIAFFFYNNGNESYRLNSGNLKQRIVNIFGKNYSEKVVSLDQSAKDFKLNGFIGKPEYAKKTKGEQYFFVNKRFIKSPYLSHAVKIAFENIIGSEYHPFYVINIELDPSKIDINVHPTKTEIKFEDERLIYNYVKVAVKQAIGQYSMQSIDFNSNVNFGLRHSESKPSAAWDSNTYRKEMSVLEKDNLKSWQKMYEGLEVEKNRIPPQDQSLTLESSISEKNIGETFTAYDSKDPFQLHQSYIVTQIKSGMMLIDQQTAHRRILYEKYLSQLESNAPMTQKQLFAQTIEVERSEAELLKVILPKLHKFGFEINHFGDNTFIVNGIPAHFTQNVPLSDLIETTLSQYKDNIELQLGIDENISRSFAVSASIKKGKTLSVKEMKEIIDQLFACKAPVTGPTGKKCFVSITLEDLVKKFN